MISRNPRELPEVLSVEEAAHLLEAAPGIKYKAALGVAYGAGLGVSEVAHLKVDDIDSTRMPIRVEQGKGRKDRNAMLSPQLLELLRVWWREGKRRGVMLPHGWLFPGRSCTDPISSRQLHRAVQEAAEVAWLAEREANLLPIGYFHVVFTLPVEVAVVAFQNKALVYDLLFRAASETVLRIAADPKHLGARIGITAVLHTWGSAMTHHLLSGRACLHAREGPCAHDRAGRRHLPRRNALGIVTPCIPPACARVGQAVPDPTDRAPR